MNTKKTTTKITKASKGLGRGFDSLIPQDFDKSLLADEQERVQKLLITDIIPAQSQPRTIFDEEALNELSGSIKRHGVLQPIVVRTIPGGYSIVAGERRWRAAQLAGFTHIPAIVRTLEELEQLEIALIENVQRVDLSPLEQAISIQRLHEQFNIAYAEIAQRLGKALSTINNIVRLLGLPPEAQEALRDGIISEGHARTILSIRDLPDKQSELLEFILKNHWSVRQAEQFALAAKKGILTDIKKAKQRVASTTPDTEKLSKHLGVLVSIRRTAKGGKLELGFKTDKDLDKLIKRLAKN
jgi:ParB family chromosome partitioning protein